MKKSTTILLALLFCLVSINQTFSQEKITPPAEGKTVIYFLRTTNLGGLMNFRFFEKDKFIGKFNGKNFIRYECEPGESVFWVKAENIDFIETSLAADKIYIVEANAVMGGFSAGVKFRLVDFSDEKQMGRINKLLEEAEGVVFTQEELQAEQTEKIDVIQKGIITVQKKRKRGKKIKKLTADMNYSL